MNGNQWGTLGVAHYRNGEWQEAVTALEQSLTLQKVGSSTDFFFLAMAKWQLGDKDEAREWYDKGVKRMAEETTKDAELRRRFRDEAAELLGIKPPNP